MKTAILLLLGTLLFSSRASAEHSLTEWERTVDEIVDFVIATHPEPFRITGRLAFERAADQFRDGLRELSEEQRVVRAMQLVALLEDGHSQLEPFNREDFVRWYPFRLYEFDDGYFFTGVHINRRELVGAQLLTVNGRPVEEAVASARALMGADNDWDRRRRLYAFHNAALMRGLGYADELGSLELELLDRNGERRTTIVTPVDSDESTFDWTYRPEFWGAVGGPEEWIAAWNDASVADLRELDPERPPRALPDLRGNRHSPKAARLHAAVDPDRPPELRNLVVKVGRLGSYYRYDGGRVCVFRFWITV